MLDAAQENAFLLHALASGWIEEADLKVVPAVQPGEADGIIPQVNWGPRVHHLLLIGKLSQEQIVIWRSQGETSDLEPRLQIQDAGQDLHTLATPTQALDPDATRALGFSPPPSHPSHSNGISAGIPAWVERTRAEGHPAGVIRNYELGRLLGQGGMGQVFLAFDPVLGREVALKIMLGADRDMGARFLREARAQARIEHPNVCRVFEAGEFENQPYIVMQFIRGKTLDQLAHSLSREQLARVFSEVCDGLQEAHSLGQVHRDIKPGNIMVESAEDGSLRPYLMDFGLVRDASEPQLTASGLVMGTPAYMSPEQARGERTLDRRADVYSLGASLYQTLTGKAPFEGGPMEVVILVMTEEPVPPRQLQPDIPQDLETIIQRAMEKEPGRRYASARALADDLRRWLRGESLIARPITRRDRLRRWIRKSPALAGVTALSAILAMGFAAYTGFASYRTRKQNQISLAFGQMAERMESVLRTASLRPLHSTGVERQAVHEQMAYLQKRMAERGGWADAPGHFALGKAHLALGELRSARLELQKAWDAGFRPPELSQLLGRTLARLYQEEIQEVTGKARELREKALAGELRNPAMQFLANGSGTDRLADLLAQGLLAWVEDRPEEALIKAREARRLTPWNDEGWLLEGEIHLSKLRSLYEHGDGAGAQSELSKATSAFDSAISVAPSSPDAYAALARAKRWQLNLDILAGQPKREVLDAGLEACRKASIADPSNAAAQRLKGLLLLRWYDAGVETQDAAQEAILGEAVQALQSACDKDPSALHFGDLAWAWGLWVEHKLDEGNDPTSAGQAGIAAGEKALKLNPELERARYWVAQCEFFLAEHGVKRNIDPLPRLRRAADLLEELNRNNPRNEFCLTLGVVREQEMAALERDHKDPTKPLEQAMAAFAQARALDPSDPVASSNWLGIHQSSLLLKLNSGISISTGLAEEDKWLATLQKSRYPLAEVLSQRHDLLVAMLANDTHQIDLAKAQLRKSAKSPNKEIREWANSFLKDPEPVWKSKS